MNAARTVAAQLTPAGRGAVATIAIRGPHACAAVAKFFRPPASTTAAIDRISFGTWQRDVAHAGEELVICRTSADTIEIHCHGGSAAVEAIIADLHQAGAELIDAPAWVERATSDPLAASALIALAEAPTQRTAAILLDQYRGALGEELRTIRSLLSPKTRDAAALRIDRLKALLPLGLHLTKPFRVVLAGAPNVGKSSLINALLGYDRSIVFDQPGTTRDVVSAVTAFDGWPIELSDTAGMRTSSDALESAGIERAALQLTAADLILWVHDAMAGATLALPGDIQAPVISVVNKVDLLDVAPSISNACFVSAKTGVGLPELSRQIVARLVPEPPGPGAAVPFLAEHAVLLESLRQQIHD